MQDKSFRFENAWLREPTCHQIIKDAWSKNKDGSFYDKINECTAVLSAWGQEITGSFKRRISICKKAINHMKGRRDEASVTVMLDNR